MTNAVLPEKEERSEADANGHLSHSRIDRYLRCPEQYRLYYVEKLRPRFPSGSLWFGQLQHQALAALFERGDDPAETFLTLWEDVRQAELTYKKGQSWEVFRDRGCQLLKKFVSEQLPKIGAVKSVEQGFSLNVTGLDLPFIGVIDLVTESNGGTAVIDFKTSSSAYAGYEAIMSDQLTAYQLAVPEARRLSLCLLVRTKEPRIEWLHTYREGRRLIEYLSKVKVVAREIQAGHFYKRPGKWCSSCDYLPVCLADKKKAKQMLVRIK